MNKIIKKSVLVGSIMMASSGVYADRILAFKAEAHYGFGDVSGSVNDNEIKDLGVDKQDFAGYSLAFEHFVPMIPNVKLDFEDAVEKSKADVGGSFVGKNYSAGDSLDFKLKTVDAIGYYQILDGLGWVSADLGLGYTAFGGEIAFEDSREGVDANTPIVYAMARVDAPMTNWYLGADLKSGFGEEDVEYQDARGYVGYDFDGLAFDVGLRAGYKMKNIKIEDYDYGQLDSEMEGPFAGIVFKFL